MYPASASVKLQDRLASSVGEKNAAWVCSLLVSGCQRSRTAAAAGCTPCDKAPSAGIAVDCTTPASVLAE